jgi:hypothetical protein
VTIAPSPDDFGPLNEAQRQALVKIAEQMRPTLEAAASIANQMRPALEAAARTAELLQPHLAHFNAVSQTIRQMTQDMRIQGIYARQQATFEAIAASFPAVTVRLPVPTTQQLWDAERQLQEIDPDDEEQVEAIAEAVAELPQDAEKLGMVTALNELLRQIKTAATNRYAVFLFVFALALLINPVVVSAFALAYAVFVSLPKEPPAD